MYWSAGLTRFYTSGLVVLIKHTHTVQWTLYAVVFSPGQTSVSRHLPDSLTTWKVSAVGVFKNGEFLCPPPSNATCFPCVALQQVEQQEEPHLCVCAAGICVAEPVQVSVSLPLSVDIPLPYQVVRGEQVELSGSVYNQHAESVSVLTTPSSRLP